MIVITFENELAIQLAVSSDTIPTLQPICHTSLVTSTWHWSHSLYHWSFFLFVLVSDVYWEYTSIYVFSLYTSRLFEEVCWCIQLVSIFYWLESHGPSIQLFCITDQSLSCSLATYDLIYQPDSWDHWYIDRTFSCHSVWSSFDVLSASSQPPYLSISANVRFYSPGVLTSFWQSYYHNLTASAF